jgi:hypothetical protein
MSMLTRLIVIAQQAEWAGGQRVCNPLPTRPKTCNSNELRHWLRSGCTGKTTLYPDLARLAAVWAKLPKHVRQTILMLADGCR